LARGACWFFIPGHAVQVGFQHEQPGLTKKALAVSPRDSGSKRRDLTHIQQPFISSSLHARIDSGGLGGKIELLP
jgi:hypothetical protein